MKTGRKSEKTYPKQPPSPERRQRFERVPVGRQRSKSVIHNDMRIRVYTQTLNLSFEALPVWQSHWVHSCAVCTLPHIVKYRGRDM